MHNRLHMLLFCFSHPPNPLSLPISQHDPEACCLLQGTSCAQNDGRAEGSELQSNSEEESTNDSDDESLPESEDGSSVALADKVCIKLVLAVMLLYRCIFMNLLAHSHVFTYYVHTWHVESVSAHRCCFSVTGATHASLFTFSVLSNSFVPFVAQSQWHICKEQLYMLAVYACLNERALRSCCSTFVVHAAQCKHHCWCARVWR